MSGAAYEAAEKIALKCGYPTATAVNVLRALRELVEYEVRRGARVRIEGLGDFAAKVEKGRTIQGVRIPAGQTQRPTIRLHARRKLTFVPKKDAKYL